MRTVFQIVLTLFTFAVISMVCITYIYIYEIRKFSLFKSTLRSVELEEFIPEVANYMTGTPRDKFEGKKTRKFMNKFPKIKRKKLPIRQSPCTHWFVLTGDITSKTDPRQGLHWHGKRVVAEAKAGKQKWCCVIVGNNKNLTHGVAVEGCLYLGPKEQQSLPYQYAKLVPNNNLPGKKNLGYLFAIQHGAQVIFDGDDLNAFSVPTIPLLLDSASNSLKIQLAQTGSFFHNPFTAFGPDTYAWPRGFPLDEETSKSISSTCSIALTLDQITRQNASAFKVGIIQLLADNPDLDGLFRMTQSEVIEFSNPCKHDLIVIPPGVASPYNSQATLHMYTAFFGLYLPVSINDYFADIWRGYFTQCLLWKLGIAVAFQKPFYIRKPGYTQEKDLYYEYNSYRRIFAGIEFLAKWASRATSLPRLMEELAIEFYEREYWEEIDVLLLKAWINDLQSLNYKFPPLLPPDYVAFAECIKSVERCSGSVHFWGESPESAGLVTVQTPSIQTFQKELTNPIFSKSKKICCGTPLSQKQIKRSTKDQTRSQVLANTIEQRPAEPKSKVYFNKCLNCKKR